VGTRLTATATELKVAVPQGSARVKFAIVFSLMVDGPASPNCRIFGRLRPVMIVRKTRCHLPIKALPAAAGKSSYSRGLRQVRTTADRGVDKLEAIRRRLIPHLEAASHDP
jgi:hypothetical protein